MRHGGHKIHKRVAAQPPIDTKYGAVLVELESQGFGGRKRAKTEKYLEAWSWGAPGFDSTYKDENTGRLDLDTARRELLIASKGSLWNTFDGSTNDDTDYVTQSKSRKRTRELWRTIRL